jgi:hypothetical protein
LPGADLAASIGLRRLTTFEYDNTLRDLLGETMRPGAGVLPADARTPFDNDHTVQEPSKALVDGLELIAREATDRLLADKPRLTSVVGCAASKPDDADCFRRFVTSFGRRALRRPLSAEEVTRYEKKFLPAATTANDFGAAVALAVQAFLQHPELVYRTEIGKPVANQPGLFVLSDFEIATRLSYFLWGAPPADWMLDLAGQGALSKSAGVRDAAWRMLGDARARALVERFHALWLGYESMSPPTPELGAAMKKETSALIERVVFETQKPWRDLLRAEDTFVDAGLARHYGLPAGATGWTRYPAGPDARRGLLSHATFLSNGAKAGDTSPTMRGIAIRELLMCDEIPPPPPGVDSDTPPAGMAASDCKEDRYNVHRAGGCASCHALIDPIGFGLERYDHQGRYRTSEPGNAACAIRGQGAVDGIGNFSGPAQLSDLLLTSGKLESCLQKQLYRFAVGRTALDANDKAFLARMAELLGAGRTDFRLDELLLDFVSADAFRHRRQSTL